jgi:hypothetical protein
MQETLKVRDDNPLFHKYLTDGNAPKTYISPDRRKEIYSYMRLKVNCAPVDNSAFSKAITYFQANTSRILQNLSLKLKRSTLSRR